MYNHENQYRCIIVREGVKVYVMKNVEKKIQEGKMDIFPLTYRLDFSSDAIDYSLE